jgi:transposase
MRPNGSSEILEGRRRKAIELLKDGLQPVEVARLVGVDRRSVRRWKAAYRQKGMKAIEARPTDGRPSRLNPKLKKEILRMLRRGPSASGYKKQDWTYALIARAIKKNFKVSYHRNYIGPLLRSMVKHPAPPNLAGRKVS